MSLTDAVAGAVSNKLRHLVESISVLTKIIIEGLQSVHDASTMITLQTENR